MNFSKMDDKQLISYFHDNQSAWRKMLTRFAGFLRMMYSSVHSAFASGVTGLDMSGMDGSVDTASGKEITFQSFDGPTKAKAEKFIEELDMHNDLHNLTEYVEHLQKLSEKSPELEKVFREAVRLHSMATKAYHRSLRGAQEMARDTIPDKVGEYFDYVQKHLKSFGSFPSYGIVGVKGNVVDFVQTTDISEMPREDDHSTHLVIVTTCRLEPTENEFSLRVFVNVLDRLALPFKYNLGTEVTSPLNAFKTKIGKYIKRELAMHNVVSFAAPEPLKLDAVEVESALSAIDGVESVSFEDNAISFAIPSRDRGVVGQVIRKLRTFKEISKMEKNGHHVNVTDPAGDGLFRFTMVRKLG